MPTMCLALYLALGIQQNKANVVPALTELTTNWRR